jgi:hypothetical protein
MRDFARWRDASKTLVPAELARTILDESGYTAALRPNAARRRTGGWKTCPNSPARWRITRRWAISSNTSAS